MAVSEFVAYGGWYNEHFSLWSLFISVVNCSEFASVLFGLLYKHPSKIYFFFLYKITPGIKTCHSFQYGKHSYPRVFFWVQHRQSRYACLITSAPVISFRRIRLNPGHNFKCTQSPTSGVSFVSGFRCCAVFGTLVPCLSCKLIARMFVVWINYQFQIISRVLVYDGSCLS